LDNDKDLGGGDKRAFGKGTFHKPVSYAIKVAQGAKSGKKFKQGEKLDSRDRRKVGNVQERNVIK